MKKEFAEGLSRRTVEVYLDGFADEGERLREDIEQGGIKVIGELAQGFRDYKSMQDRIEPFCGDIDLRGSCQDIDALLNDIDSDNSYLDCRLNLVKSTFY